MRIFVASDTHQDLKKAIELYDKAAANGPIDCIIHCGDHYSDGIELGRILGQTVYAVHGNCDGYGEDFKIVETPAGRILVTHGHYEGVDYSLDNVMYLALQEKCAMVCFGHTHKPVMKEYGGIRFVNPGSTARPRRMEPGSAAVVTAETGSELEASIIYL